VLTDGPSAPSGGRRGRPLQLTVGIVVSLALLGCGGRPDGGATRDPVADDPSTTLRHPSAASTPTTGSPVEPTSPTGPAPDVPVPVGFSFTARPLDDATRSSMDGVSMRLGCPVPFDELRLVDVTHWDFDGEASTGQLVIHQSAVDDLRTVFATLYDGHFPIRRMHVIDQYGAAEDAADGADDFASIEDDNTSAFNCRTRTGSGEWSQHSYGTAIDVNPIENPYVSSSGATSHPASVPFLDRSDVRPGMAVPDGVLVRAFESVGWTWGGTWTDVKDLQHFSKNGR
jgi:hypothetical protein